MKIDELSPTTTNSNRLSYNGKEIDKDLNWYHYGARFYDPAVGRWWVVDAADEFNTPYGYVGNDPISFLDPDGNERMNKEQLSSFLNFFVKAFKKQDYVNGYNHYASGSSNLSVKTFSETLIMSKYSSRPIAKEITVIGALIDWFKEFPGRDEDLDDNLLRGSGIFKMKTLTGADISGKIEVNIIKQQTSIIEITSLEVQNGHLDGTVVFIDIKGKVSGSDEIKSIGVVKMDTELFKSQFGDNKNGFFYENKGNEDAKKEDLGN